MTRIAPSILAADFSDLYGSVRHVEGAELLHLDVMDGHFVPNISFGMPVVRSLRRRTDLYFDTHLMIEQPAQYLEAFEEAGSDRLTVHPEACDDLRSTVDSIRSLGLDAGVALNPGTPIDAVEPVLDDLDVVLLMSVEPGFGGQDFMPETLPKIERLDAMTDTEIAVDGGVNRDTAPQCARAGADTLVVGSSVFGQDDPGAALRELQQRLPEE